jgi:DNA-binding CsgD family transcriptional regulator
MWTPLSETHEEGTDLFAPTLPSEREATLGPRPDGLRPREYMVLGKVFEGKKVAQIAAEMGVSTATVSTILGKPQFKAAVQMVEAAIVERIARGEFGVLAIAKANANGAIRRVVGLSKLSQDDRVRLNANLKLIELAGIRPPAPQVVESKERLIDAMTAEEAREFAATGLFPARFRDQLARLAVSVVEEHEKRRWQPKVEMQAGEVIGQEPAREMPAEVVAEDEKEDR